MKPHDVQPITELERDAAGLIGRARERRAPIVITEHGRATAILQDAESFQEDRRAFALLKLAIGGERDITNRRGLSYETHRERMTTLLRELKNR